MTTELDEADWETSTVRTLRLLKEEWQQEERERIAEFLETKNDPGYVLAPEIREGTYDC